MSDKTVTDEQQVEQADPVEPTDEQSVDLAEADAEETAVPTLEEQLEDAKVEAAKNLDGWMRAQAELANARKRLEKERSEVYLRASADVAAKLLPVIDDFERALENVPDDIAENGWLEGMQLVYRKLTGILDGMNVTPIKAVGEPFDPMIHEAIMQEPSEEYESGIVTKELQKGYQIGNRVIRPSLVNVAE